MEKLTETQRTISEYPIMGSPWYCVGILGIYIIFLSKIGPSYMKDKPPFDLRRFLLVFNFIQIIINGYLFYRVVLMLPYSSLWCNPPITMRESYADYGIRTHYYYTLLKIFDFADTFFILFRKKNKQISFLHVYHHISTFGFAWITCNYFPGGHAYFVGFWNTFVHILMHFYYLLTAAKHNAQGLLWYKKLVTIVQLVQHWSLLILNITAFFNWECTYPKWLLLLGIINMSVLIYMFSKFYKENYLKPEKKVL